jgi:hypothetical protein
METEQERQAGEPPKDVRPAFESESEGAAEADQTAEGDETAEAATTPEALADETTPDAAESESELFGGNEREEAERRWRDIQARFVDDPRTSVEEANALVTDLMDRLVSGFGEERSRLEAQWEQGEDVTTEELRVVLQRYRSFFGRLLDV